jgi:glycogen debranching enzyme
MSALMCSLIGTWPLTGALDALGALQASERDDWRDAEPGKIPHELRRGELAHRREIPHTPYYGTHDSPSLYCLALWEAWRWTGDRDLLAAHIGMARACLAWLERLGERDGDGLQEYATRSPRGYYNQSWKDAGTAIVHEDGTIAPLPIATVELQGYLFAARLAMAELYDALGEPSQADAMRTAARALRELTESRYWTGEPGRYAMALDGDKRPVTSTASNPGHLLWTGLPSVARARATARELLRPDMFSGWGLRTLSSEHPRYNPLSYQNGSVWPHDTLLAAAGMWRYGLRDKASELILGVLEAASMFEGRRPPSGAVRRLRPRRPPTGAVHASELAAGVGGGGSGAGGPTLPGPRARRSRVPLPCRPLASEVAARALRERDPRGPRVARDLRQARRTADGHRRCHRLGT